VSSPSGSIMRTTTYFRSKTLRRFATLRFSPQRQEPAIGISYTDVDLETGTRMRTAVPEKHFKAPKGDVVDALVVLTLAQLAERSTDSDPPWAPTADQVLNASSFLLTDASLHQERTDDRKERVRSSLAVISLIQRHGADGVEGLITDDEVIDAAMFLMDPELHDSVLTYVGTMEDGEAPVKEASSARVATLGESGDYVFPVLPRFAWILDSLGGELRHANQFQVMHDCIEKRVSEQMAALQIAFGVDIPNSIRSTLKLVVSPLQEGARSKHMGEIVDPSIAAFLAWKARGKARGRSGLLGFALCDSNNTPVSETMTIEVKGQENGWISVDLDLSAKIGSPELQRIGQAICCM
jgi:hypothetical protein